ncbi:copper p-type atpase [Malassezia pachydermatis]|uniref:P-type Cu(+) transporter n=1 Tax=Malassezia pachydermatis TaxID=77020 RepID=A0A0N0RS97_9BASI|nr:copper p-type atpase [Malassezia pachydermatis]KOS14403.1 copper p-type atpase [Malassezia pachydermatis]
MQDDAKTDQIAEKSAPASLEKVELEIKGMTCGACVASIETMLGQQEGIKSVSVALLAERAVVQYDAAQGWTPEKVAEEVDDIGFEARVIEAPREDEAILSVFGMTCSSCTSSVEHALLSVAGVESCGVSLTTQQARIRFDPQKVHVRDLVQAVEDAGFDAILFDDRDESQLESLTRVREVQDWWRTFLFSLSFAVPEFMVNMVLGKAPVVGDILHAQLVRGLYIQDVLALLITLPVQFGVGRRFFVSAYKSWQHGSATMDTLVILGTTASWVFSLFAMLFMMGCRDHCYKPKTFFDTSTMLITFVSLGRYLENAAKGRTSEALTRLIRLTPQKATIYMDSQCEQERVVPVELLQVGDIVKLVPGEKIAADGIVKQGHSLVDESMITGEHIPVSKTPGSQVIGGTVNGSGTLDFVVTRAGKDTNLHRIVKLVQDAQTTKAPIQDYADRVAGVFVPCILVLSALTLFLWLSVAYLVDPSYQPHLFRMAGDHKLMECFKLCISVIVVACPCALGLSTPTAVMVGTGVGAANGILVKSGGALEAACTVSHIVFDKTGTLTRGRVRVLSQWHAPEAATEQTAALVHAIESKSEHVLAQALVHYYEDQVEAQPAQVEHFDSIQGAGVRGQVTWEAQTHTIVVGHAALHTASTWPTALTSFAAQHEAEGCTLVYVAVDETLTAAYALADEVKSEARWAVECLQDMGIRCSMMTGDTRGAALAVAREVGIAADDVHAGLSPNGKMTLLQKQRVRTEVPATRWARMQLALFPTERHGLAMVGDGINDSPALASADVGIALCSGSDIAMGAASIVLMRNDLTDVPIALLLCRRIFMQIRLNFLWATMYNIVMIPIAMGLFLPWGVHMHPMMAGLAMTCSSVSVVLSSLSLKRWQRPDPTEAAATVAVTSRTSTVASIWHRLLDVK